MFMYGIMWGMKSAVEWLQSCSANKVCVHIWHHVGYLVSAPEWLQFLRKSSFCSYMTQCGVYGSGVAPEIKFVFIYVLWSGSSCSGNQVCVYI